MGDPVISPGLIGTSKFPARSGLYCPKRNYIGASV